MRRLLDRRPSPAMTVALIALFVALGGAAVAAIKLPRNSVGKAQLQNGAVTGSKLGNGVVTSVKVRDHSLLAKDFQVGQLVAGAQGPQGSGGPQGPVGPQGPRWPAGTCWCRGDLWRGSGGW
jgi:hypothetical protein